MDGENAAAAVITQPDTGVLLLQVGGPAGPGEVRKFIYRMLSDPAVVAAPKPVRIPLAALAALTRAPLVKRRYKAIGGGSPIRETTIGQATALERALDRLGRPMPVAVGMRYTEPTIRQAVDKLAGMAMRRIVLLPLYPQFSNTTTGSAFLEAENAIEDIAPEIEVLHVRDYADHQGYAAALAETVHEALTSLTLKGRSNARVLFSAHGIPVKYVDAGDPYPLRVAATVEAVVSAMEGRLPRYSTCFQSRVGPVRWLSPDTGESLAEVAAEGADAVVLVPVAFVSDHLETLYDMDIRYRDMAMELGIREFARAPALNDSETFIQALAGIVTAAATCN